MSIVSPLGGAFAIVSLLVYHLLPLRARSVWLLGVSYVFHCWLSWRFVPVLLVFTLANHFIAGRLHRPSGRAWLWTGVALDIAALAALRSIYRSAPFEEPFAVLGLSFYSLQAMSYLVDLRRGDLQRARSSPDLRRLPGVLSQAVAGPIERAGVFLPQLTRPRVVDDEHRWPAPQR